MGIKPQVNESNNNSFDPIIFWTEKAEMYPKILPIAQDILSIPASSTLVEIFFSKIG